MRRLLLGLLCVAFVGFGGCGGGGSSPGEAAEAGAQGEAPTGRPFREPGPVVRESAEEARERDEPDLSPPVRSPEGVVVVEDLIEGTGRAARPGDRLEVHMTSVRYSGEPFETIWGEPYEFELSSEDVNAGWVSGLPGMREGGRRKLLVPGPLTSRYASAQGGVRQGDSLMYVVDLIGMVPGDGAREREADRPWPVIRVPAEPYPRGLVKEDLIEGRGPPARRGDELTLEYAALTYEGNQFINSWERSDPTFSFVLGSGDRAVIPGWERGLGGMRLGGRRELIVPEWLLSPGGSASEGKFTEGFVYVVDLVGIRRGSERRGKTR